MLTLFKALFLLASIFYIQFASSVELGPSDLELGTLGVNDTYLFGSVSVLYPVPGLNTTSVIFGVSSEYILINYVLVQEHAGNTEARSRLVSGGPGYNSVEIEMIPGPPQFFNYTIDGYGIELPGPEGVQRTIKKYEIKNYA